MRLFLMPHPRSCGFAVDRIEVEVERPQSDQLSLSYTLTGEIQEITIPRLGAPVRRARLWDCTCFEAFLRVQRERQYYELNFSPSTEWAIYTFDDYRIEMREASEIDSVDISWRSGERSCTLDARLKIGSMQNLARSTWQIGLSAVIDEHSGARSYWSLAHPTERPDFHHPASFAYELTPREQA